MKLALFGGTGGVGQQVIKQALDAGHEVTAFARDPASLPRQDAIHVVAGELSDYDAIARVVADKDAVLSTLGARENTPEQVEIFGAAMLNITRAMKEHDVKRLVAISGAGVLLPDDNVSLGRRLVKGLLTIVAKHIAKAKQREADIIRGTDLEWVLVRPPRIVRGERSGRYRVLPDRVPSARISQGDVADLVLRCAISDEWVRRAPIPGY